MAEAGHGTVAKKIEGAANIGIVIIALLALGMFVKNYLRKPSEPKHIAVGEQLGLKNANWQASGNTIVFGISTTCHFCTESAGFYRELVQECAAHHVQTIATLPQPVDEAKRYLASEGVTVNEVRQVPLSELKITGTPTLLLVDKKGTVQGVWVGKLPPDKEKEIMAKLGS